MTEQTREQGLAQSMSYLSSTVEPSTGGGMDKEKVDHVAQQLVDAEAARAKAAAEWAALVKECAARGDE